MVKIRLQKLGRRNRAYFRIVVTDARVKRQGLYLEKLGHYDPIEKDAQKQLFVNTDRVQHWIKQGAQPTEAVENLLKHKGIFLRGEKGAVYPPAAPVAAPAKPAAAPVAEAAPAAPAAAAPTA